MTEKELAAELQLTRDDATEWGDPIEREPAPAGPKRRLAAMVSVRLSPEELDDVQVRAEALGLTVSSHIRRLLLEDLAKTRNPIEVRYVEMQVSRILWTSGSAMAYTPQEGTQVLVSARQAGT